MAVKLDELSGRGLREFCMTQEELKKLQDATTQAEADKLWSALGIKMKFDPKTVVWISERVPQHRYFAARPLPSPAPAKEPTRAV